MFTSIRCIIETPGVSGLSEMELDEENVTVFSSFLSKENLKTILRQYRWRSFN